MKKCKLLISSALVLATSYSFSAAYNSTTPLDGIYPITFDEVSMSVGDVVTNQFSSYGISFGNTTYFDSVNTLLGGVGWNAGAISGSHVGNFYGSAFLGETSLPGVLINFNSPASSVVVGFVQGSSASTDILVEALMKGSLVESFSTSSIYGGSPEYLGFTGIEFDQLRITNLGGFHDVLIDNVQVSSVPIPAAAWLFGSGLMGLVGVFRKIKSV